MGENEFLPTVKPKYYPKIFLLEDLHKIMPAPAQNTKYNKEVITDYVKLSRGLINGR